MKIGELIFDLGFRADTMKLKDFGKALGELNLTSILTAGSFGAIFEGAKALIGIADDMALGINKFGRETGQSTEEVQKWNKMAERMGVSAGVVTGSVATLEDNLFKMKFTGEGSGIWNMLGLDPTHTSNMFEVLTMLRERLKGMRTEQQRFFLENLGLSTEMINMFKLTDAQWSEISKIQTMSVGQLSEMDKYHQTMVAYGQNLKMIWADLGVSLMPIAKSLMDMANSIDTNIVKSWEWKGIMDTISQIVTGFAHPIDTLKNSGIGDIMKPITRFGHDSNVWAAEHSPFFKGSMAGSGGGGGWGPDKVNVHVNAVVHSNDPHTHVKIYQEGHDRTINNAVNDRPEGSY